MRKQSRVLFFRFFAGRRDSVFGHLEAALRSEFSWVSIIPCRKSSPDISRNISEMEA